MQQTVLYSRGTPLAEVLPDFRGQPLRAWLMDEIGRQTSEALRNDPTPREEAWISKQKIWTKRDGYGWRS